MILGTPRKMLKNHRTDREVEIIEKFEKKRRPI